ncbi:MAG: hypothetical protein CMF80_00580 [Candidatus Marinimicrobia bacterium]|nr:hypothetical protein [Candidatus Neomarinimicrobiota bacterium]
MKKTCLILFLINIALSETIYVNGKITDTNGNPIEAAEIISNGNASTSGNDGYFTIKTKLKSDVNITHIAYEDFNFIATSTFVDVILNSSTLIGDEVYVNSGFTNTKLKNSGSSISIIGKNKLKNSQGNNIERYLTSISNVSWAGSTSRPKYIQIRGIGERRQYAGDGNPIFSVGTSYDDVDLSGIGLPSFLFDLNQIEVFKGPQSTMFGSNSMAGQINYISNEPSKINESNFLLEFGNDNQLATGLAQNLNISDNFSSRVTLFRNSSNGFRKNLYYDVNNTNKKDESFLYFKNKMSSVQNSTIYLNILYTKVDNGFDVWTPDNNDNYSTYSDMIGRDYQTTISPTLKTISKINNDEIITISNYSTNNMIYSFDGDWANDEYWSENFNYNDTDPYWDTYGAWSFADSTNRERKQFSHEIRLIKNLKKSQNIFGIYYKEMTEKDDREAYLYGGKATNYNGEFLFKNYAFYAEHNMNISKKIFYKLTARYDDMKIDYKSSNYDAWSLDPPNFNNFNLQDYFVGIQSLLKYVICENSNVFLGIKRGYKPGGINQDMFVNDENVRFYKPEYNINYELTYKNFNEMNSTEFTLFHMIRKDPQVNLYAQLTSNPVDFHYLNINAENGYNSGFEFFHQRSINNKLNLSISLGYLMTNIDEINYTYEETSIYRYEGGREQAHAPNYNLSLTSNYKIFDNLIATIEFTGVDSYYFSENNDFKSDPYNLFNGSILYQLDSFDVIFWGKNLTNEKYALRGFYFALDPSYENKQFFHKSNPLEFGITLKYNLKSSQK